MAIAANLHNTTFHVGDTVRVHYRIIEKEIVSGKTKKEKHEEQKDRIQVYEGIVLAIRGSGDGRSFVVRRMGVGNIGIERIFPFISPWIKKITVKKKGNVRRAKLYYLRDKTSKEVASIGQLIQESGVEKKVAPEDSIKPEQKTEVPVNKNSSDAVPASVTSPALMKKLLPQKKKQTGKSGELLAASFLQQKGYRIISRNFRCRFGEIDLIATRKNRLIFVEVKARHSNLFGEPQEAVGKHKLTSIITTGEQFISLHEHLPRQLQIDVIAIDMSSIPAKITHFENVTG